MIPSETTSIFDKRRVSGFDFQRSNLRRRFLRFDTAQSKRQAESISRFSPAPARRHASVKRIGDLLICCLAFSAFALPMLFLALLIKLTSRGPVLYSQERIGLSGTIFTMWKFRSMRVNAEERTGPVWAAKNDSRRTWLGTKMRRTGLDELPQLFNVLRGEMSIVGPRPERSYFVERFSRQLAYYDCRHLVKPGITGWAQVNRCRGNTSIEDRLVCDLEYVQHQSFTLDLRILLLTPLAICADSNGC